MKKILFSLLVIISIKCYSQVPPIEFDELNIPSSPAFVLIDQSPASIEKPTNPKDFALSLLSIADGGGAIEFSPYWLKNRPDYTLEQDVKNKYPIKQTLAFSVISVTKNDTTIVGAGFRFQVFRQYQKKFTELETDYNKIQELLGEENPDYTDIDPLVKAFKESRKKLKWNIELAGAYSGIGTSYKNMSTSKIGAWLNIRHTPAGFPIDFVVLARYTKEFNEIYSPLNSTFLDSGLSISRQGAKYDFNLEYIKRKDFTNKLDYDRVAFVLNYEIMKGIVGVASFGKDFKEVDNLFSIIGIKVGISNQKMKLKSNQE